MRHCILWIAIVMLFSPPLVIAGSADADSLFALGMEKEKAVQFFQARKAFASAIERDPDNRGYQEHYAWFLSNTGFHNDAVSAFLKLNRLKDDPLTDVGLGWNQLALGDVRQAVASFRKIMPELSHARTQSESVAMIRDHLRQRNVKKMGELTEQLQRNPVDTQVRKELFRTHIYLGEWKKAEAAAGFLRTMGADDASLRWEYARMLFWRGDFIGAEQEFARLAESLPDNPFILWQWAKVLVARDLVEEAGQKLEEALREAPDAPELLADLAVVRARQGKTVEALLLAKSLQATGSRKPIARLTLAHCFYHLGSIHEARNLFRSVLVDYPGNEEALAGLARLEIDEGELRDGAAFMARIRAVNPDSALLADLEERLRARRDTNVAVIVDWYDNSSDFSRINSGVVGRGRLWRETVAGSGYIYSRFAQRDFSSVNRHSVFFEADHRLLPDVTLWGWVSGNFYDGSHNHVNARLAATLSLSESTVVKISYEHIDIIDTEPVFQNALYNPVVTLGAVGLGVTTDDCYLYLRQKLPYGFELWGKGTVGGYSDGNTKVSAVAGIDRDFADVSGLKASYSYFYLDYRRPAPLYSERTHTQSAYYDPSAFSAHTAGLTYRDTRGRFSYGGDYFLGFLPRSSGLASTVAGLAEVESGNHSLRGEGRVFYQNRGLNRTGNGGHFNAKHVLLVYSYRF